MIKYEDTLSLNFYNYGNPFTGSCQGMRYRIIKQKAAKDDEGNVIQQEGLLVSLWPEPFSFDRTDEEQKVTRLFDFSQEGKQQAVDWMNDFYEAGSWKTGFTASGLRKTMREGQE